MKRMVCVSVVVAVIVGTMAMPGPSQTQPPRTNDEWQQGQQGAWGGAGGGRSGSVGSTGTMPPDFLRQQEEMQQRIAQMQQRMEQRQKEAQENRNRAIRELLGADAAQWRRIKPILDKIEQLKGQVHASIDMGSFNGGSNFTFTRGRASGAQWGGGFSGFVGRGSSGGSGGPGQGRTWQRSWSSGTPQGQRGEVDEVCHELLSMLQNPSTPAPQINQKVIALRQAKERARTQLMRQQNRLRKQTKPQQEPALIVMGYLD